MARPSRDEAAATLAARELRAQPAWGRILVLEDPLTLVHDAVAGTGADVCAWSRRRLGDAAWPPDGPVDTVALRLPRAREEFEMLVHIAADRLRPGGRLLVYGANDEGIKPAPKRIAPLFGRVATLATGGHARLLGAQRPAEVTGVRATREAWRTMSAVAVPWRDTAAPPLPWVSYPGVFAHERLDGGTALLLRHLPPAASGTGAGLRVLDWGAGSGFLAAGVRAAAPEAEVTMVEIDALAAAAAAENVPGARIRRGDGWAAVSDDGPFDVVVANPPYHRGKEESMSEVRRLLAGVATGMARRGVLRLVVQRRLPVDEPLAATFAQVREVADEGPYRVWEGRR